MPTESDQMDMRIRRNHIVFAKTGMVSQRWRRFMFILVYLLN
jgi:hypothetical protein